MEISQLSERLDKIEEKLLKKQEEIYQRMNDRTESSKHNSILIIPVLIASLVLGLLYLKR